jgi:hypothetical protein
MAGTLDTMSANQVYTKVTRFKGDRPRKEVGGTESVSSHEGSSRKDGGLLHEGFVIADTHNRASTSEVPDGT